MNSFTDESRLWKRLVWFEAVFLKKNAPKLLEMSVQFVSQEERRAIDKVVFSSENNDTANHSVDTSFFTSENNCMNNRLASLAQRS